jgi:hypothetical protein
VGGQEANVGELHLLGVAHEDEVVETGVSRVGALDAVGLRGEHRIPRHLNRRSRGRRGDDVQRRLGRS